MLRYSWLQTFRGWFAGQPLSRRRTPRGVRSPSHWSAEVRTMEPRVLLAAAFSEFVDPHPAAGNQFGHSVVVLETGNVVITSPFDDAGGQDAGAVYLFNGATGALISTLKGATANDHLGIDGAVALTNGNFVVCSSDWDNGALIDAGAVTWGNGLTGITGTVSAANSLVGGTAGDVLGRTLTDVNGDPTSCVVALDNGNYVVASPNWSSGLLVQIGAATWGNGTTGVTGGISAANSLVGATSGDGTGGDLNGGLGITPLTNGNYVVTSGGWSNGINNNAGAVTWANGTTGRTGAVSAANSLAGTNALDAVGTDLNGNNAVTALTNGNYVVSSPSWQNGAVQRAGAVTWGNGTTGTTGPVALANSVVGSQTEDLVGAAFNGESGVTALTNGNYVISSARWDNGGVANAGAATWVNGATGGTGTLNNGNSLVGTTADDFVGAFAATALTNGNYVVASTAWNNGAALQVGAVTWGNGTTGTNGAVTAANSLIGATTNDAIGFVPDFGSGVTALSNGNYVVASPLWDRGAIVDAGAATWGNGTTGTVGTVGVANSLYGSTAMDKIGGTLGDRLASVTPLTNGNYVVSSIFFDNGGLTDIGAATFGNGATGTTGAVSPANSLVGVKSQDSVGIQVTPLANGNYVVASFAADNGALVSAGAVTIGNGLTGVTGPITAANSLVGSTTNDGVGIGDIVTGEFGVTPLLNGNYVVVSPSWTNGVNANAGAVTFGSGNLGVTGPVTIQNSVVGTPNDTGLLAPVTVDDINDNFYAQFPLEGGGKVRVGSQFSGFANVAPDFDDQVVKLAENSAGGTVVPYTVATDTDAGQTLAFAITAGNRNNAFAINATTGQITVNNPAALDFENEPPYNLTVTATDNGNPALTTTATIRIFLTDANDAPLVYNHTTSLAENTAAGTNVFNYSLIASDQDAGQTRTYAITNGNTNNAFAINATTGQITVNNAAALDFENTPPFILTISVTDNGTPALTSSAKLGISLTDVNDAPNVYNAAVTIPENSAAGTNVLNYSTVATDQDKTQTLTYAITAGNRNNTFAINATTGQITVASAAGLDFENEPFYDLTIQVTDSGNPARTSTASLKVFMSDANDAPLLYNATVTVPEKSAAGTAVLNYSTVAFDQDKTQTLTYAITAGNTNNAFKIDAATGAITVNTSSALDLAVTPKFDLTISVTDNGNPAKTSTATLTVNLTAVAKPPVVDAKTYAVKVLSPPGTVVGTITSTDPDGGGAPTYTNISSPTILRDAFAVNATTGVITVQPSILFVPQGVYELTIRVADSTKPTLFSDGKIKIQLNSTGVVV